MKRVFAQVCRALEAGERAVLCTVVDAAGSAPRGAGARMAVLPGGRTAGTVGGGPVEHACQVRAEAVLAEGGSRVETFSLRPEGALGMVCGGDVTVHFQRLEARDLPLVRAILARLAVHDDTWLVTDVDAGGAWRAWIADGPGGLPDAALAPLLGRRPVLSGGAPRYYVEPLGRAGRIYVFGGGHVSRALVPVLAGVDFPVVVCEDRPEFADPARFPAAEEVALLEFGQIGARFALGMADGIVVMTRGHRNDYDVLRQALATEAGYIGVIGSRAKAAATFERLRADGFGPAALERVHTPIGLAIGAETPEEIAVSVAAELIRHRAIRTGGRGRL